MNRARAEVEDLDRPDLSVLVVAFRNPDLTVACLRSIFAATHEVQFEVLAHDNESGDGTAEAIAEHCPEVDLSFDQGNLGFARANNLLAERASGRLLLLLNPDTIVHDGAIDRLVAESRRHPEAVPLGGRTMRPNGELDPGSCWGEQTPWSLFCFATGLSTAFSRSAIFNPESLGRWKRDSFREVGMVTGCLALLPAEAWHALGGFDETFWMYGEDADLSARARSLGYTPAVTPEATITHIVGASSRGKGPKLVLVLRSKVTLIRKHWTPRRRVLGMVLLQCGVALRALLERALSKRRQSEEHWLYAWHQRESWSSGFPDL